MTKTFHVELTIPDNEAFTALETLGRLGLPVARVARADVWQFEVDEAEAEALRARVAALETIHNPNKHRLVERDEDRPGAGEVWVAARDERPATAVAGRAVPGVRAIRRRTAWRLIGSDGRDVDAGTRTRALAFLVNPAFQVAITPPGDDALR